MDLSAQEIVELRSKLADIGVVINLPSSKAGVKIRADKEGWASRQVSGKGGRGGIKTVYTLPAYAIDEMREKGVLHWLEDGDNDMPQAGFAPPPEEYGGFSDGLSWADRYGAWAIKQDTADIVPVRYYKEVFASAGQGAIPWDTSPEAMWFRSSFLGYLGVRAAECFCTRIDGDSMFPTLIDQGTALWQACGQYTREGIYLFRQHDELRVKRLQRINTYIYRVISDNPNKGMYPTVDLDVAAYARHEFEILGKYLWSCGIAK